MPQYRKTKQFIGRSISFEYRTMQAAPEALKAKFPNGIEEIGRITPKEDEFFTKHDLSKWVNAGMLEVVGDKNSGVSEAVTDPKIDNGSPIRVAAVAKAKESEEQPKDYDLSPLEWSVRRLKQWLAENEDYGHVKALLDAENAGKQRKGALTALEADLAQYE